MRQRCIAMVIVWQASVVWLMPGHALAQADTDSVRMNMPAVFAAAMGGNMQGVLQLIDGQPDDRMMRKHLAIKKGFQARFGYDTDRSGYLADRHSAIDSLLLVYVDYWRCSLLGYPQKYDSLLRLNLTSFLRRHVPAARKLKVGDRDEKIDRHLTTYIRSRGLHTTGFSRTGQFLDLLVWGRETDTTYVILFRDDTIRCPVVFMEDFVTLGWNEYATMNKLHPGGWAKKHALYCVKQSYNLESEDFRVSYLLHEGRHFEDYKLFPHLSTPDLEYRAKLAELTMLDENLFNIITVFITQADRASTNAHQVADYYVIHDLSQKLFGTDFEKDPARWKTLNARTIHDASYAVLQANTAALRAEGKKVEMFIAKEK